MVGSTGGGPERRDLPAATGTAGSHPEEATREVSKPTCNRSSTPIGRADPGTARSSACTGLLNTGHEEVVDADLSDYFGQIPHADLLRSIARRVSDGRLLGWVKAWLEMAVEEDDGHGW